VSTVDAVVGLVIVAALIAYLLVALIVPEKW
jgi:K+-transporting ATPase KdpF subunit